MSLPPRLCLLVSVSFVSALTACGSDTASTSCDASNLCTPGYVCVSGQCELDNTGHPGGDPVGGDPGGDGGDGGDGVTGGDDGGDSTPLADSDVPDTTGPTIDITAPKPGQMIGGVLTISVTVSDPSGLAVNGVVAYVGSQTDAADRFVVTLDTADSITWTGQFNTFALNPNFTFPWIGVRATDSLGNETDNGFLVTVDTTKPRVGFSSPEMQTERLESGAVSECTPLFAPLGDKPQNFLLIDGETYSANVIPRLRIEDEGNSVAPVAVYSGIDDTNARIYFLPYTDSGPKLVQPDANGDCAINPAVLPSVGQPTTGKAVIYNLVPFTSDGDGAPDFQSGGTPAGPACTPTGSVTTPVPVCDQFTAQGIYHWITYGAEDAPAVYGLEAYDPQDLTFCTGGIFDQYNVPEGPTCVAASVADQTGNVTVTAPIAVCFDRGGSKCTTFTLGSATCSASCTTKDFSGPDPTPNGSFTLEVLDK